MNDSWRIRADTGGTFTDAWALDSGGREHRCKVLSDGTLRLAVAGENEGWWSVRIPWELPDGFFRGWRTGGGQVVEDSRGDALRVPGWAGGPVIELSSGEEAPVVAARILTGAGLQERLPCDDFRVATTRGTNALLEQKGARVALFVTEGFEDLLEIRDQRRELLFDLRQKPYSNLAEWTLGVKGRMGSGGETVHELDECGLRGQARKVLNLGAEIAVVALMHAWHSPEMEEKVRRVLVEEGFRQVVCSAEVAPVIRLLPRAETSVVEGFLSPVMRRFVERVSTPLDGVEPRLMTSAGGLVPAGRYQPKDSLLSGPAGGLIGAAAVAKRAGFEKVLTFDMGGTSTDVARFDGEFDYRHEQQIGPARVLAPALKIETVAAGGGSICQWRAGSLVVGPESAGADPGPACYGRGGPLTLTDVNLLLGLMDSDKAGIPLYREASEEALSELIRAMESDGERVEEKGALLEGLRSIALETMAEAVRSVSVRDGENPEDYALLAFGGAGPQHACDLAARLGVGKVIIPGDAGLLSAWGLERAVLQEHRVKQVLKPLSTATAGLEAGWRHLADEAEQALDVETNRVRWVIGLRLAGQDSVIEVELEDPGADENMVSGEFASAYRKLYGYDPVGEIEVTELRVVAEEEKPVSGRERFTDGVLEGPSLRQDVFSTCVIPAGWSLREGDRGTWLIECVNTEAEAAGSMPSAVKLGLFRSRFEGIVTAMGELLRRTALSTNVKERLDFSCALLDAGGNLVASAPHVPVHLGALGVCVRETLKRLTLEPGDVAITNHPGAGGSHLPDVTLIAGVYAPGGDCLGYVANRAHHAEIGGSAPGSMPAGAVSLAEEGVVIAPGYLLKSGGRMVDEVEGLLRNAPYPSRRPGDNLADLEAQLAACHYGVVSVSELAAEHGAAVVREQMAGILKQSAILMVKRLESEWMRKGEAELDGGGRLVVTVEVAKGRMRVDFSGTSGVHAGNLNASPSIVRSVLLYVLRLWIGEDIPLNEGLLEPVELVVPEGMLNPPFSDDPESCPAVVGGNVETSQRLADLLIEVFALAANGPGTMNNFLFGDREFGYYETLGGGAGAGPGFDGVSCRQVNMTNTALTDPEVLEHRYPVRVLRHRRRMGSGGDGAFRGGDGVVRELEFLQPLTVSFLTQRRETAPKGLEGGGDGAAGRQTRVREDGTEEELPWSVTYQAKAGERVVLETPGGGGWGVGSC